MKILEVVGLTCHVGSTQLLDALSFTLEEGEILALCGPPGAGKTACLRCLGGALAARFGPPHLRRPRGHRPRPARAGPAGPGPRRRAAVAALVADGRGGGGAGAALAPAGPARRGPGAAGPNARARTRVAALLERVGLAADARRRRDALDRGRDGATRTWPRPSPCVRACSCWTSRSAACRLDDRPATARLIGEIRAQGVSVLLTEREPALAKAVADRVATLERGAVIPMSATPSAGSPT